MRDLTVVVSNISTLFIRESNRSGGVGIQIAGRKLKNFESFN